MQIHHTTRNLLYLLTWRERGCHTGGGERGEKERDREGEWHKVIIEDERDHGNGDGGGEIAFRAVELGRD